jgi:hypothetical protein
MTHRPISLLLILGLLVPQAPLCMAFDVSELECSTSSCCCDVPGSGSESDLTNEIVASGSGDCSCELSEPGPAPVGSITLAAATSTAQWLADPTELDQVAELTAVSVTLSSGARAHVPRRPLRITHGVRLI